VCGEYVCLVVRRETFTDSYRAEREGGEERSEKMKKREGMKRNVEWQI
jgi:hypothetical protein